MTTIASLIRLEDTMNPVGRGFANKSFFGQLLLPPAALA